MMDGDDDAGHDSHAGFCPLLLLLHQVSSIARSQPTSSLKVDHVYASIQPQSVDGFTQKSVDQSRKSQETGALGSKKPS